MTERRSLSPMQRLKVFEAAQGRCHICARLIRAGELWDVSHDRPLGLLGEDGGDNLKVAHRTCHKIQTGADMASITKAKRCAAKHAGIRKPPAFKSKWRKKMNGEVVLR